MCFSLKLSDTPSKRLVLYNQTRDDFHQNASLVPSKQLASVFVNLKNDTKPLRLSTRSKWYLDNYKLLATC